MSYKQEKIIVIMSEFINDKREYYPITNVPIEKARFFYKDDDGLFKIMSSSDYAVRTETNEMRLYITNEKIKNESLKFQVGYEINFSASEYETSLPVLSVLVEMYNTLIEDSRTIFNYVKKQCFISDDKTTSLILPNLPSYTVWCMGENGEMFALPVNELYSKFGEMLNKLKSILADYTESKKEEIRGATFFPHLIEDGTLSWTNDKNKPNPEPVNIKGPAGTIENVTASVNSNAGTPSVKVTMSGTKENRSFDLQFENLKGDMPVKGEDYLTPAEKEQFTTETIKLVTEEGDKVVREVKSIVAGNPATSNALTLGGKTRVEFDNDIKNAQSGSYEYEDITNLLTEKGYINNDGTLVSKGDSNAFNTTDYLQVDIGDTFLLYGGEDHSGSYGISLYDNDKRFIKGIKITTSSEESYKMIKYKYIAEEKCYVRFSLFGSERVLLKEKCISNKVIHNEIKNNIGNTNYYKDITDIAIKNGKKDIYLQNGGKETSYSGAFTTDFIPVKYGEKYKFKIHNLYQNICYQTYSLNKTPLEFGGKTDNILEEEVVIDEYAKYIRFSTCEKTEVFNIFKETKKSVTDLIKENENSIINLRKEFENNKHFYIPSTLEEIIIKKEDGYLTEMNAIQGAQTEYAHTDYIELSQYTMLKARCYYGWSAQAYLILDESKKVLYSKGSDNGICENITLYIFEILSKYPTAKYIRFVGHKTGRDLLRVWSYKKNDDMFETVKTIMQHSNKLFGKKIAFCGDSFTEASNLGEDFFVPEDNCYKSFGWRIANRNGMNLYHNGVSGSTMHVVDTSKPTTSNPFAHERYKKVPKDCDYIILQFGLNESSLANDPKTKGTKESVDTTTMWGSWNVVLEYLIKNCPMARIGVVMSDAWMPQNYFVTLKEICEWWGIPLLDLGGDPNIPVMNGGRRAGSGLSLNPKVAEIRNKQFYQDFSGGDSHPNDAGHEWRSSVIENFIRSL